MDIPFAVTVYSVCINYLYLYHRYDDVVVVSVQCALMLLLDNINKSSVFEYINVISLLLSMSVLQTFTNISTLLETIAFVIYLAVFNLEPVLLSPLPFLITVGAYSGRLTWPSLTIYWTHLNSS